MLDIKLIRENPKLVKDNTKKRDPEKVKLVDEFLKQDKQYREALQKIEKLRHQRNLAAKEINELKKQGKDIKAKIKQAKEIPQKINKLDEEIEKIKSALKTTLMHIPNIMHDSVPKENKTVRKSGTIKKPKFPLKSHVDLLEQHNLADTERAAKVAG